MNGERQFLPPEAQEEAGVDTTQPSFASLQAFTKDAIRAGIHFTVPRTELKEESWQNQWSILSLYLSTDATLEEIGAPHGVVRERVRQIVKQAALKLHRFSPEELQQQYPLENLVFRKPLPESVSLRMSDERGGKLRTIFESARAGKTAEQIKSELSITGSELSGMRGTAAKRGITIPFIQPSISIEFRRSLEVLRDPLTPDAQKQELLDKVGKALTYKSDGPVLKLSELHKEAGLRMPGGKGKLTQVIQTLREAGIPASIIEDSLPKYAQRYGVIAIADRERALTILKESPALAHFRGPRH